MKKIYIAGCGGMLGDAFYKIFNKDYELKCTDKNVNENWISFLDFRNFEEYEKDVKEFKPDYLFHLGAHTDLEYCADNPEDAYLNNTLSVEKASRIANDLNIPLLYISTAGIFDGKKERYDDWDQPNPLNAYGRSKYLGEKTVQDFANEYLICRAGWMVGGGPKKDKKYINKIMNQIKEGAKELHVVDGCGGIPTYTYDFAKNVKLLIEKKERGLYNMVCSGKDTDNRLAVTNELVKILNKEDEIKVIPVDEEYFKKEYYAKRPTAERLLNRKLDLKKLNIMRPWQVCLKEYLEEHYSEMIKK
jgi:dTDP-4-dehydrorhamnose reductase